jgi:hypothetical protein
MPIGSPNPNTGLIFYSDWMALTHSRVYGRSTELKQIDVAIKQAEDCAASFETVSRWYSDLSSERRGDSAWVAMELDTKLRSLAIVRVGEAFTRWKNAKGNTDWRTSNRNGEGAMTRLSDQLTYLKPKLPVRESAALAFVEAERNRSIPVLFKDCKVVGYSDRLTSLADRKTAVTQATGLRTVYERGNAAGMGAPTTSQAEALMRHIGTSVDSWVHEAFFGTPGGGGSGHSLIDDLDIRSILTEAVHEIKADILAIAPIAGLSVASATLLKNSVTLVMQSVAADDLVDLERKLDKSGDSRAAVNSLKRWQAEAIAKTTSSVVRSGVNVGTHAAAVASLGVGIPVQLAVSIANAVIALALVIGDMGMQYRRRKALERYLNQPTLDAEIFAQSPLAAAYYLLNSPTSHIALQLVRFNAPGWQEDVERLKKDGDLQLVISQSAKVIDQSKYRIRKSDMAKFRETSGPGLVSKIKDSLRGTPTITT